MPEFGEVAVRATDLLRSGEIKSPRAAWNEAAVEILENKSAQDKNCPRATFLTLCQEGLIIGVPRGSYVNAKENADHTLAAVKLLLTDPALAKLAPLQLWRRIMNGASTGHDYQMHVVLNLWNRGLIAQSSEQQ